MCYKRYFIYANKNRDVDIYVDIYFTIVFKWQNWEKNKMQYKHKSWKLKTKTLQSKDLQNVFMNDKNCSIMQIVRHLCF